MENLTIRPETPQERQEIYNLIRTAFETAQVKDGTEQDFAEDLRNGNGFIPELALVGELSGKLIGHIMLTRTQIVRPDGEKFEALLLAPLSVLIEYRNKGVGSALVKTSLGIAKKMGYKAVFLVGNPDYYNRFGFRQTSEWSIRSKDGIPEKFVLGYELKPEGLKGISGVLTCC